MKKQKTRVTQELCRKVQIMLAGGAKMEEIGQLLDIGKTTVSRIKTAGFNAEQYKKNTAARKAEEKKPEQPDPAPAAEEQCAGQISMEELQQAEEQKPEMSDTVKLMRFLAHKFDSTEATGALWAATVSAKLDKVIDYLAQILRKMDGAG